MHSSSPAFPAPLHSASALAAHQMAPHQRLSQKMQALLQFAHHPCAPALGAPALVLMMQTCSAIAALGADSSFEAMTHPCESLAMLLHGNRLCLSVLENPTSAELDLIEFTQAIEDVAASILQEVNQEFSIEHIFDAHLRDFVQSHDDSKEDDAPPPYPELEEAPPAYAAAAVAEPAAPSLNTIAINMHALKSNLARSGVKDEALENRIDELGRIVAVAAEFDCAVSPSLRCAEDLKHTLRAMWVRADRDTPSLHPFRQTVRAVLESLGGQSGRVAMFGRFVLASNAAQVHRDLEVAHGRERVRDFNAVAAQNTNYVRDLIRAIPEVRDYRDTEEAKKLLFLMRGIDAELGNSTPRSVLEIERHLIKTSSKRQEIVNRIRHAFTDGQNGRADEAGPAPMARAESNQPNDERAAEVRNPLRASLRGGRGFRGPR